MSSKLARQSRARVPHGAKAKGLVSPRVRIGRILELMLTQKWERGVTGPQLATELGVSLAVIERDASEASHLLDFAKAPEAIRDYALAECRMIVQESENDRVPALRLMLEATGNLKQRHEVTFAANPAEMYADALREPGFREWLIAQGWTPPPAAIVETTGEEVRSE